MSTEKLAEVFAFSASTLTRPKFTTLPPLALYVHVPWCLKKCPYCDFNSHEKRGDISEETYIDALLADLETALPSVWGRKVRSVFIGGGTPSLFAPGSIDRLLSGVRARVPIEPDAEITLEANPGTFEREKFDGYHAAGINRLSIGVQSFDPRHLAALGRVHGAEEARRAVDAAMMIFDTVNVDLMYALPGQTLDDARRDLETALEFSPPHLSFYHLTIEPNTLFHRHPPALPDDDAAAEMEEMICAALARAGYFHYETSACAKPARECRHNINYWRFGDYLGIGAGAHSKLSFADAIVRQLRWKHPQQYMARVSKGEPLQEEVEVTRADVGFEFMLNALRLAEGVPTSLFAERTGFSLSLVSREIDIATRKGLLEPDPAVIRPTPLGRRFLNDLQQIFLPDSKAARKHAASLIHLEATGVER